MRTSDPTGPLPELPADLAERLQELARTATAGSRPWPGVDRAVRRSRRRRVAVSVGVTAALAGGLFTGLAVTDRSATPPPATGVRSLGLERLREAGYAAPPAGNLAHDRAWLAGVRSRVAKLAPHQAEVEGRAEPRVDEVLVPWTSRIGTTRYALVAYVSRAMAPDPDEPAYTTAVLAGPAGAGADRLTYLATSPWAEGHPGPITSSSSLIVSFDRPVDGHAGLALVSGPGLRGVAVATQRHFEAAGAGPAATGVARTRWRPLHHEGASIWAGLLDARELSMAGLRIDGGSGGGSGTTTGSPYAAVVRSVLAAAPPGTDTASLGCAARATQSAGASIDETPVISLTTPGDRPRLGVSVLRTPDGPFVVGFCSGPPAPGAHPDEDEVTGGGTQTAGIFPAAADPGTFMAILAEDQVQTGNDTIRDGGLLVVAPAGAVTVETARAKVRVHHRLARLPRTSANPYATGEKVRARDSAGRVIATAYSRPATTL
jgi:hypothetical protein